MYQLVLYAFQELNLNVITIENPVEQLLKGITQVSVNHKAGIDYVSSFKAILRCDPDVILIGEIRDRSGKMCYSSKFKWSFSVNYYAFKQL